MLLTLFVGDVNATMEKVVNLVSTLETLGLSREMEVEADRKGMELILAANIDPRGMIRIFEKLTQDESSQEEEIKNKGISRKKDTEFFITFPPIRQVRTGYSI
ncbi:MAG: M48 family metalloprotease [Opitutae bacterium]|nr:M48 family metalloprotease [Opitutae bacterium]